MSDIDTAVVDSLKALDLKRPIREADIGGPLMETRFDIVSNLVDAHSVGKNANNMGGSSRIRIDRRLHLAGCGPMREHRQNLY